VAQAETRVVVPARLEVAGFSEPVTAQLISYPDRGEPSLNRLYLHARRFIEPGRDDEALVGEAFAAAHRLRPGDTLYAVIHGRRKALTVVGTVLSPEFVYQIAPGAFFPDFERYGILWLGRTALAAASGMEKSFNDVSLTLNPGASEKEAIARLDDLLRPYGGLGAYGREDQLSHRFLSEEFRQLEQMARIFPVIFLGVAAFLLNVVSSRLVATQREQIAVIKAFGYSDWQVGLHYLELVLAIVLIGALAGLACGVWLGKLLSGLYMEFYRFPFLEYTLAPSVALSAVAASMAAAALGTLGSVRQAVRLPPAQAMRPDAPARYHVSLLERAGPKRWLGQGDRMILRHLERRPAKALLSIAGLALACAILMVGRFQEDAIDYMINVQFGLSQRDDLSVNLVDPASRSALYELQSLPGVVRGEAFRTVPATLVHGHRHYRTAIQGLEPGGEMQRLLDTDLRRVEVPKEGVVLTDYLGKLLGLRVGDTVTVEVREGSRPVREVTVVGLVSQFLGVSAYMNREALNRLMGEGDAVSGINLAVDAARRQDIVRRLNAMPRVAGIVIRKDAVRNFYDTMGETLLIFTFINTLLAATIAFGVVYNTARIGLSERSRELASLRVLGYTRGEIAYLLLGELALLTLAAIPLGFAFGHGLCAYIASHLQTDLYRVPLVLEPRTYAFAAVVVLASTALSALMVRRRLDRLDLIGVLKTKE
ncbi:MAG: FtsX-like permease family protein, partial [Sulfuricellaceae bacterium]|nr:FtsX-like permease family protein [Sulfuricellaceae bacterium]